MQRIIRIGTRESQLAVWQAEKVRSLLTRYGFTSELVFIKSEGDIDLHTPLYAMGVQGVFTRSLDSALLNDRIDIAVHSMKDVPTQLPAGIVQAAVLERASYKDVLVLHPDLDKKKAKFEARFIEINRGPNGKDKTWSLPVDEDADTSGQMGDIIIATSSVRRIAQWKNQFPHHKIENLRGNVNTRLHKLKESNWHGAIFAAAGLERIGLLPSNHIELNWMLPAPAQGAIMVVCREKDDYCLDACNQFNDTDTALAVKIERDFLKTLLGGCSTPISALAEIKRNHVHFSGNILSVDGKEKAEISFSVEKDKAIELGIRAGEEILKTGGRAIVESIRNAAK